MVGWPCGRFWVPSAPRAGRRRAGRARRRRNHRAEVRGRAQPEEVRTIPGMITLPFSLKKFARRVRRIPQHEPAGALQMCHDRAHALAVQVGSFTRGPGGFQAVAKQRKGGSATPAARETRLDAVRSVRLAVYRRLVASPFTGPPAGVSALLTRKDTRPSSCRRSTTSGYPSVGPVIRLNPYSVRGDRWHVSAARAQPTPIGQLPDRGYSRIP